MTQIILELDSISPLYLAFSLVIGNMQRKSILLSTHMVELQTDTLHTVILQTPMVFIALQSAFYLLVVFFSFIDNTVLDLCIGMHLNICILNILLPSHVLPWFINLLVYWFVGLYIHLYIYTFIQGFILKFSVGRNGWSSP